MRMRSKPFAFGNACERARFDLMLMACVVVVMWCSRVFSGQHIRARNNNDDSEICYKWSKSTVAGTVSGPVCKLCENVAVFFFFGLLLVVLCCGLSVCVCVRVNSDSNNNKWQGQVGDRMCARWTYVKAHAI